MIALCCHVYPLSEETIDLLSQVPPSLVSKAVSRFPFTNWMTDGPSSTPGPLYMMTLPPQVYPSSSDRLSVIFQLPPSWVANTESTSPFESCMMTGHRSNADVLYTVFFSPQVDPLSV